MTAYMAILLGAAASYLLRILPVALLDRVPTPRWLDRAGVLVAPVAFAAMAASAVAGRASTIGSAIPPLAAITVAAVVAWRSNSTPATLAAGMATLWTVSALTS
jgi:branched-subunit amino acid transport protein